MNFTATLAQRSPRYQSWLQVFGNDTIYLKHPLPAIGEFPEVGVAEFYELDLDLLTTEQRERMIVYLAQRFGVPEPEVRAELDRVGCPILANDIVVIVSNPQCWF